MARKLRLEFPGAIYHVINRGNYRSWVFRTEGAKQAFEACLADAATRSSWVVHAYVIMGRHGRGHALPFTFTGEAPKP
jgi:putative transposase